MTYDDFLLKVLEVDLPDGANYSHSIYIGQKPETDSWYGKKDVDEDEYLVHKCETGGTSGGSCWEDSDPQPYSTGESLGRFTGLSKIVRALAPDINFLEYEDILDLVETDVYEVGEYYGNGTDYAYQAIRLKDLWAALSQAQRLD